jgi:acyl-coenzyme A synthetase/AMP-(fatty) acid ligase
MASTLLSSLAGDPSSVAVIIPSKPAPLAVTYSSLAKEISRFQAKLAALGVGHGAAVSIALVNSYEFVVSFLASATQRAIAAPLNSAYKQEEFEFYIEDITSAIVLVPRGAVASNSPAVRAARRFKAAIAECYWDESKKEVALDVKDMGKLQGRTAVLQAEADDVALILHTR